MRTALRRFAWWLLDVTAPRSHDCSGMDWHAVDTVTLRAGDAHETSDEFGPTIRFDVISVRDDYFTLRQSVRCPDNRAHMMEDYLERKFTWVKHQ